ncbi:helix-turn-helix domain-containing protein [uncultured Thiothrix sp.]|uniref:MmyB family transcriptional regulator n=1 Tax=uncultured Thiothrix sp. TaxID=223185 RepID=UPI0026371E5D|nr:helix-turn-helix domain-containing protein [uncultured Thiothrix sp.]
MKTSFAQLLRQWRQARRYSQLQLALELNISSRHLCFMETGRAQASREMLLKIARFLLVPKAEINQALLAAGYAPLYTDQANTAASLKPALTAIEMMLNKHLPYPALVFNPDWDVVNANSAALSLLQAFNYQGSNFIELLLHDQRHSQLISNWAETAAHTVQRIHQESLVNPVSVRLKQLEHDLAGALATKKPLPTKSENPVIISTQLQLNNQALSFFSVLAQLGSVQDLTISEYKIELMFPADQTTAAFYQAEL